ncbi:MAG TPA: DUF3761 domain-containing protein [Candidatus Paceibacterota bacterium]|nr:DUF3761 domain-containing protein [Candidatus Paceibacterota bacterium]
MNNWGKFLAGTVGVIAVGSLAASMTGSPNPSTNTADISVPIIYDTAVPKTTQTNNPSTNATDVSAPIISNNVVPQATQVLPNLSNNNYYINSDGNSVHSPAYAPSVPAGASAKCRDGTYSFSQHRQGTCSRHGGVATWY